MRLLLALVLVLVAGAAHAATLHLSLPRRHAGSPRGTAGGGAHDAPTVPAAPFAHTGSPSIVFEARRTRHARVPTQRETVASARIHVHDGDTFYLGPEAFRLRGIDTPELGQPRAESARERLRALLHSGPVTIVRRAEDVYGRIVVDVFVGGRSVARILKAEGYAKPSVKRRPGRRVYRSLDIPTPRHASYVHR